MINKVYMLPKPSEAALDNSNAINQIVLRLQAILPMFGWQITEDENEADIIAVHAGQTTSDSICNVAHVHGLYPTGLFPNTKWHWRANENVIRTIKEAKVVTVPSDWVAEIFKRDMNIEPEIVHWAIKRSEWHMGEHRAYTLWNKTRVSAVCDPTPIYYLAENIDDAKFVSTFLPEGKTKPLPNLEIIGRQPFEVMQQYVHDSSVYLSTTKETFGIGILEAMATGSPVLGYRWGAIPDIVTHGVNGYLVEPHDLQGLVTGWKWIMRYRRTLSWNARQTAVDSWYTWERVAQHIASIYDDVLKQKQTQVEYPEISVIIPNHNYDEWVIESALSVLKQETNRTIEVIIVNDNCDNDQTPAMDKLNSEPRTANINFNWVDVNFGSVSKTRNHGIELSQGNYIMCLDADDRLARPDAIEILASALDNDHMLGIAYGKLAAFKGDIEKDGAFISSWPSDYNPVYQIQGKNQVPSCCLFRRQAFNSTGGYRQHLEPTEDAGNWTLMALNGWKGEQVTNEVLYYYRMHDESLSSVVRTGQKVEPRYWELHHAFKTGRYPLACAVKPQFYSHPIFNYDMPKVSVIIPVGKYHADNVIRAIDSIASQTYWNWECIVVNDTGKPLELPQKWAKIIGFKDGNRGAGYARNLGIEYAQGDYLVFLDADDKLEPEFIEKTLLSAEVSGKYVYTDWYDANRQIQKAEQYQQENIFKKWSIHAMTVLIKKEWVKAVGMFDSGLESWEDTDLFFKLAISGYCGQYLSEPLFEYDYSTGKRRNEGLDNQDTLKPILYSRFKDYIEGDKMPKRCCGKSQKPVAETIPDNEMVEVVMVTGKTGSEPIVGTVTKTRYGNRSVGEIFYMYANDAKAYPKKFKAVSVGEAIQQTPEPNPPIEMDETPL